MKFPRFRFSLRWLLVLPVVVGVGLVWHQWPGRTFDTLKDAILNEEFVKANSMVSDISSADFGADSGGIHLKRNGIRLMSTEANYFFEVIISDDRSFVDILLARQTYKLPTWQTGPKSCGFIVERGKVNFVQDLTVPLSNGR